MRPLKPRTRSLQLSGALAQPLLPRREGAGRWPWGRVCGALPSARGKPISQIIGLGPPVVPRYPAFIRLPDWGPGEGRRRRGSNYRGSCPVASGWRRGGRAGRAEWGRVRSSPAGRWVGGHLSPREAPAPRPALCPAWAPPPARRLSCPIVYCGVCAPPSRLSLAFALPPFLPLPSPSSRKKEEPVCGDE